MSNCKLCGTPKEEHYDGSQCPMGRDTWSSTQLFTPKLSSPAGETPKRYVKVKDFPTSGGLLVNGDVGLVVREYVEPASEWSGKPEIPMVVAVNAKWSMPLHLQPHQFESVPEPVPTGGSAELKPCPFCGGIPFVRQVVDKYSVMCGRGVCMADGSLQESEAEAIAKWNRRNLVSSQTVSAEGDGWIAVRSLVNEVTGVVEYAEDELRATLGNTNFECLRTRLEDCRDVLPAPPVNEETK